MPQSTVKVFLDTNILQDVVSQREGYDASLLVLDLIQRGGMEGACSALSIPTLWYINRKLLNRREKILDLLQGLQIIDLTQGMIQKALSQAHLLDLEDELQYLSAQAAHCPHFLTRNTDDFPKGPLHTSTPEGFLTRFLRERAP